MTIAKIHTWSKPCQNSHYNLIFLRHLARYILKVVVKQFLEFSSINIKKTVYKKVYFDFEFEFKTNFDPLCFYAARCCTLIFFSYSFFSCFVHIVETDGAIVLLRDFLQGRRKL